MTMQTFTGKVYDFHAIHNPRYIYLPIIKFVVKINESRIICGETKIIETSIN